MVDETAVLGRPALGNALLQRAGDVVGVLDDTSQPTVRQAKTPMTKAT